MFAVQSKVIDDTFCGDVSRSLFEGRAPIHSEPLLTFPKSNTTAIAMTTTGPHTVAFIGTSDGYLKKVNKVYRYNKESWHS